MEIKSQYKIMGPLLAIVFLNFIWGFFTYIILYAVYERDLSLVIANWGWMESWVLAVESLFLALFFTQLPVIRLTKEGIQFSYPMLFFIKRFYRWDDFDEAKIVEEYAKHRNYEAIWLIKNGKLKKRISSAYYRNYHRMNASIQVPRTGRLKMSRWQQIWYLFGGKIQS